MTVIGAHLSSAKGYLHMGKTAVSIGANTFQFFECYACVMLIYWVITLILTFIQKVLEKRCNAIY